jgi:hypothetical protein
VTELLGDVFDYRISLGTVYNVLQAAVAQARSCNEQQDLSGVRVGAHDEIFQSGRPVLVGVDADSTYCYLLSLEDHRDADTWGVQLLFAFLENRAYAAIGTAADLQRKKARFQGRGRRTQSVATLLAWLREDVLSLAGPDHATCFRGTTRHAGHAKPCCGADSAAAITRWASPRPKWPATRSGPVRWSRTSTAAYATTSSSVATWDRTIWPCSSSSSTTAASHGVSGPNGRARVRRNYSAAAPIPTG